MLFSTSGHNECQDLKTGRCAAWKMVSTRRLMCLFHAVLSFPSGQHTLGHGPHGKLVAAVLWDEGCQMVSGL